MRLRDQATTASPRALTSSAGAESMLSRVDSVTGGDQAVAPAGRLDASTASPLASARSQMACQVPAASTSIDGAWTPTAPHADEASSCGVLHVPEVGEKSA